MIADREPIPLKITEHAKVRFVERLIDVNVGAKLRQAIEDAGIPEQYETMGDGWYPIDEYGLKVLVRNEKVVTVVKSKMPVGMVWGRAK